MPDLLVRRAGRVFGHGSDGPLAIVVRDGFVEEVVRESDLSSAHIGSSGGGGGGNDVCELNVEGRAVIPGFVDAHTHLVFAGDRSPEFRARLAGENYEAGGIMSTVEATRRASLAELTNLVAVRAEKCVSGGTTTIE